MTLALQRPWVAQTVVDTPLGPLRLAATEAGLAGVWFEGQRHHPGMLAAPDNPSQRWLRQAADELARYWTDARRSMFKVPLDADGTPFQREVWRALLAIPSGTLSSYGRIASELGRPSASRAVGAAVGRNPLSILVPCHRVVGATGGLTDYAGGLHRKQALLEREGAFAASVQDIAERSEAHWPLPLFEHAE
ncbi:MAG TPA: methylated-DNA--[protein]-cysteine S-methyltransferase [Ideonella sp.]|uniref:methylated-DNA--[protein]-cysteine S-methyltransferase n=1 Tax=Ideonella sp. TaxID=1929293 RepID=UPI002C221E01|nr:methylated-DNA--[protein]-cysteine S-methyltransferase [Ideonella sp.]HSI50443.1 methylated-DNA--[protein]-cysteine S-methyltransferase [Ideonella sp.]